jgi:hypothetical protein
MDDSIPSPPEGGTVLETRPRKKGHTISLERALRLLTEGNIELHGLLPWSSNYTFLVTVQDAELKATAVYKLSGRTTFVGLS